MRGECNVRATVTINWLLVLMAGKGANPQFNLNVGSLSSWSYKNCWFSVACGSSSGFIMGHNKWTSLLGQRASELKTTVKYRSVCSVRQRKLFTLHMQSITQIWPLTCPSISIQYGQLREERPAAFTALWPPMCSSENAIKESLSWW